MACFGLNIVKFYVSRVKSLYERLGLRSKLFELDDGTTIHCWTPDRLLDHGKPSLLLIHGFGASGCVGWEKQVTDFSRHFAVYVPDLLFFGKSSTRSERRSEIFQAECLLKLLRMEDVEEVMVAGTSYGGFVAFRMADLDPKLVKKVVIASSGVCMTTSTNDWLLKEFGASEISQVLLPSSAAGLKKLLEYCVHRPPKYLPSCFLQGLLDEFGRNREQLIEVLHGVVIGSAKAPSLPKLKQQALIVWGSHDRIFNVELAKQLKSHLGESSKLVVIQNAGHLPQTEQPKEFNNCVLEFLLAGKS